MRYNQKQQIENRVKILAAVGRQFRLHGYAGVGVDALATAANVTSGAIYSQFGSKKGTFQQAVIQGMDDLAIGVAKFKREHGSRWVNAFVEFYLSAAHRKDLGCGCVLPTLTPEVIRADSDLVRQEYQARLNAVLRDIADGLDWVLPDRRLQVARSLLGLLVGGLTLARAVQDTSVADEMSRDIARQALVLTGQPIDSSVEPSSHAGLATRSEENRTSS